MARTPPFPPMAFSTTTTTTTTTWFLSLACSGPSSSSPLLWLLFVFFSPCADRILLSSLHALFLLLSLLHFIRLRLIRSPRTTFPPHHHRRLSPSPFFIATLFVVSLASALSLFTFAFHIWYASSSSSWSPSSISNVAFWLLHSIAWSSFAAAVAHHPLLRLHTHPPLLRFWWSLNAILSALPFSAAVFRISSYAFSYSLDLEVDDVVFVALFPVALFLLYVSATGSTGLRRDDLSEPLLPNGAASSSKLGEKPVTAFHTAGFLSRCFWIWLNPVLKKGSEGVLQVEDVPELSPEDRAVRLYGRFQENMVKSGGSLRGALLRSFKLQLGFTAVLALVKGVSMYVGPLLIQYFVDFLEGGGGSEGYVLVAILFFAKFSEVLSTHQYQFLSQKLGMTIRSSLITSIYRKGLRLSSSSRQSHGAGRIVNYMTVDVQQINDSIVQLHNIWILPFQVILALLILYREIGIAMLAGFATMIIFAAVISNNSRMLRGFSLKVMAMKDIRMKATTEVLNYMKIIKLQAWEDYFKKKVEDCRKAEYKFLRGFQFALAANITVLSISTSVVAIVTFGTCILIGTELTAAKVFTVISTFNILGEPIRTFPQAIISVSQALVSLERLGKYMVSEELEDYVQRGGKEEGSGCSIRVEGGRFAWEEKPTLDGIDLEIPSGHLVAVVGMVGSGKSSLLAALLGEMPKLSGTVCVHGTTAYVPQTAWIQSGTVEENILFGQPMDRSKYRRTLKACCLEQDIALFEFGDQTEIGERGINLSGGQKQRIQLARAMYQDSEIYFLDDVFSAVDAHTGSAIFKDCLLGALQKKTRVLVTHQVEFLHKADLILVMQDGVIKQSGTYGELLESGAEFGALVAAHKESIGSVEMRSGEEMGQEEEEEEEDLGEESVRMLTRSSSGSFSSQESLKRRRSSGSFTKTSGGGGGHEKAAGKLVEEEKRATGRVGWKVYREYLTSAFGPFFVLLIVFIQSLARGLAISADFWLSHETSQVTFDAALFIRIYALLCACSWLFMLLRAILMAIFSLKTTQNFYLGMLRCIFRAPMSFFDTTPTGRILTRSSTDQATLDILLPLSFSIATMLYYATLGVLIVTCIVTWPIIFVIIPLAWVYLRYQAFYISSSRELTRLDSITKAPVIHHFTETIAGFMVIRGFRKQEEFIVTNLNRVNANLKMDFHFNASNEWLGFRLEMIGAVVLCAAALLLVLLPADVISPSSAALSLSYGLSLNTTLAASVFFGCTIENKMVAAERIGQYTRLPGEAPLVIENSVPSDDWPTRGDIKIRNLTVRYQKTMPLVLKGISLDVVGGQKIGVVGRTGSGKSTLVQVMFRIIEPAGGRILFDDVDITSVGLHDLRSRLAIIPQDPVLFEGTIRTNMDPLGMHTDEEIWEGLEKCQLADIVKERTDKLDAIVVDNGENWSVGQRQLLCLGRTLLKKSRILFLDEATASVDTKTDAMLQTIIRNEFHSSTVVSIAHRIPTVMDCDMVMVLEAGLLKEYNSPAKLLESSSTLFSSLVREYTTRSSGS